MLLQRLLPRLLFLFELLFQLPVVMLLLPLLKCCDIFGAVDSAGVQVGGYVFYCV